MKLINPNTGKKRIIYRSTPSEIEKKIEKLKSNSKWAQLSINDRLEFLEKFKRNLITHKQHLQHTLSLEIGKPSWESNSEINAAINKLETTLLSVDYRLKYPTNINHEKLVKTESKPIGIIGIIGPFNFPIHIPNGQILPALLTGNTVIVKSSEYAVKTTKILEKLWKQTFNNAASPIEFVYGDGEVGNVLVEHSEVNGIFFTGSSIVGEKINNKCLSSKKQCVLEMGGNNALIIEDFSKNIFNHITTSSFITAGQRCTSASRIIINKAHEHLIDEWIQSLKNMSIDTYPSNKKPFMGPVVIPSVKNILLTEEINASTTLLKSKDLGKGGLISPRVELTKITFDKEIFGPIAFIFLSDSFEESIQIANQSKFGLSCSIYTKSKKKFNHGFKNINCGVINWNSPTTGASGLAPFGGTKHSGNYKPAGFNMIDHCVTPVATSQEKRIKKLSFEGLNNESSIY